MDTLLHRFIGKIKGVIEGSDRMIFRGILQPICFPGGLNSLLFRNDVKNKDFKDWAQNTSAAIIRKAEEYTMDQCGLKIQYLNSHNIRKEALAHDLQEKSGVKSGLIGAFSCVESCHTFKSVFNAKANYPQLIAYNSKCKQLYFYYDHEDYGFMRVRLQTWAPYEVQIAMNGREWLKRQLDKEGVKYVLSGNKFLDIENFEVAQQLLDSQQDTRWVETLDGLIPDILPSLEYKDGDPMSYSWTMLQSEWAKDYIFHDPKELENEMQHILRHAYITGTGDRVLRYMGHPLHKNGQPHWKSDPELLTRMKFYYDGGRIRHWVDKNSLKLYNEKNVLRFEFTMNDPTRFKIHRTVTGSDSDVKKYLPMRKGIADIPVRAQVCSQRIKDFTEQIATMKEDISVGELLAKVTQPIKSNGKRYRGLDVTGKDLALLKAIADSKYNVDAITNKHLQAELGRTPWANGLEGKRLSARISRHLRLLREHGLIKKLPNQHRYRLTAKGRLLTTALNQFLGANISELFGLTA